MGMVPLFVLAHSAHHIINSLTVPLLPMIREEFTLSYTQAGLIASAFGLAYGIGQLPSGWIADRIGPRVMIAIGISGVALAGLLVGLSHTYLMILVFMVLMGIAGGGYHPSASPLISASVPVEKRGQALGLHTIGGSISFFLSPLIAAAIAGIWSWRGAYIVLSIPAIILGIVLYFLLKHAQATRTARQDVTVTYTEKPPFPGQRRRLILFITLTTLTQAITLAVISFIPLFLVDKFGISDETAAALIALIFSGGLWASPLGGYLSDRWGRIPIMIAVCLITGPFLYLLNLASYGLAFGALMVVLGATNYVRMPVSEAYVIDHTSERNRSTVLGIYFFGGMEISGLLTPLIGYLIDRFGFYASFTVAGAATLVITLVCSAFLWQSRD